ncbi:MAG TPA: putative glycoside hydrolase [Spirochaetota bacterium]|nr:putative glycoside hydrolase [Spirochaetota bacterium]HNT10078.1 putative glycoside hydrolase [Spirochaetota bacterium]
MSASSARSPLFSAVIFLVLACSPGPARAAGIELDVIPASGGYAHSANGGGSWTALPDGLPAGAVAERLYRDAAGNRWMATRGHGLFLLPAGAREWRARNSDAFRYRGRGPAGPMRSVSAFAVDRENPNELALATKHTLFASSDGGATWRLIPLRGGLSSKTYITSLHRALGHTLAGTSFEGLYRAHGSSFRKSSSGIPYEAYSGQHWFYDEVSAIEVDPSNRNRLFAGLSSGNGVYESTNGGASWTSLALPLARESHFFVWDVKIAENRLYAATDGGIFEFDLAARRWSASKLADVIHAIPKKYNAAAVLITLSKEKVSLFHRTVAQVNRKQEPPMKAAAGRDALYVGYYPFVKNFTSVMKTLALTGMNALVIDMKDDLGSVFYPVTNATANEIKAVKKAPDLPRLITEAKARGVYLIARIVVFKDWHLYRAYRSKYAIWNYRTGAPWTGNPGEYWVDPHAEFVHDYNIAIAKEIAAAGFDEIQFDYIRFPLDGPVHLCSFRHRTDADTYKSEAINDFLMKARAAISAPISVDIYGLNAWYRFGNRIGQNIEELAWIVDAICPMAYPSHFGGRFFGRYGHRERPYHIIRETGRRSIAFVGPQAYIRPYLQAFNLLSPTWGPEYIASQVDAARASGCSGFALWNANAEYSVARRALEKKRGD